MNPEKLCKNAGNKKALFLDRDGVINIDHGYVHEIENFNFIDGIFDLVKAANNFQYLVIVVTNQSGIGRGIYNEKKFEELDSWVKEKFEENSCKIDATYYCPHHPIEGMGIYKKDCQCRKPNPGMIFRAMEDYEINLGKSILIGDKYTDVVAGISAGVGKNIILGNWDKSIIPGIQFVSSFSKKEISNILNFNDCMI